MCKDLKDLMEIRKSSRKEEQEARKASWPKVLALDKVYKVLDFQQIKKYGSEVEIGEEY